MNLPTEDAALFFQLMWRLQFFVSQDQGILPAVNSPEVYANLPAQTRIQVRDVLWEKPELIDAYAARNPDKLPAEYLEIIQSWKRFIAGTFFICRFLKKHTIFIMDGRVYGVLGLVDSLETVVGGRQPPIAVEAVLLPFKERIIYDGLLTSYSVYFGGNMKRDLNEDYMAAKQNDRIITTLEPEGIAVARRKRADPGKDWRSDIDEVVGLTGKMRGGPVVQGAAFRLLKASAELAQAAVHDVDNLDEMWKLEQQVETALGKFWTVLDRAGR